MNLKPIVSRNAPFDVDVEIIGRTSAHLPIRRACFDIPEHSSLVRTGDSRFSLVDDRIADGQRAFDSSVVIDFSPFDIPGAHIRCFADIRRDGRHVEIVFFPILD